MARTLLIAVADEVAIDYINKKHGKAMRERGEWFVTDLPKPVDIKLDDEEVVISVVVKPKPRKK